MQDNTIPVKTGDTPYYMIAKQLNTDLNNTSILTAILRLQFKAEQAEKMYQQQQLDRLHSDSNEHSAAATDTAVKETLIGQIGALYQRNVSLTKGHATLTRRVQELEAALETEKKRTFATWTEKGSTYYDNKGKKVAKIGAITPETSTVSKAHHDLQQDVIALSRRVDALEFAQKPSSHAAAVIGPQSGLEAAENLSKTIEKHIKQALVNATKIGGILNGR